MKLFEIDFQSQTAIVCNNRKIVAENIYCIGSSDEEVYAIKAGGRTQNDSIDGSIRELFDIIHSLISFSFYSD